MNTNQQETCTQSSRVVTLGVVPHGIEVLPVTIEVQQHPERGPLVVEGLSELKSKEITTVCSCAITSSGYRKPTNKTIVSVRAAAPVLDTSGLQLPVAIALLAATDQLPERARKSLGKAVFMADLALAGRLAPVRSVIQAGLHTLQHRGRYLVVSDRNPEADLVPGLRVVSSNSLRSTVEALCKAPPKPTRGAPARSSESAPQHPDLAEVRGHFRSKRALEIAAAGGHHLLMVGPPGTGRTMLARRLPGLLPPLTPAEQLATSALYSAAGRLDPSSHLMQDRPLRAPHHTISTGGLFGGGALCRPGELTLATNGVLMLDELPEFNTSTLEAMREPLRLGTARAFAYDSERGAVAGPAMPARCLLVGAAQPCPCGFAGTARCRCPPDSVQRYAERLRRPSRLFDLFDLQLELSETAANETGTAEGPDHWSSARVQERVQRAVALRLARMKEPSPSGLPWRNGPSRNDCSEDALGRVSKLVREARSPQAIDSVLSVARTIADLAGEPLVQAAHVEEALTFRSLDAPSSSTP